MTDRIKAMIKALPQVTSWRINEEERQDVELFFVRKTLDMNRAKKVHVWKVTLFVRHEDGSLGSSATEVLKSMSDHELRSRLEEAALAASFIKNKAYDLPVPEAVAIAKPEEKDLTIWLKALVEEVYSQDIYQGGGINSAEFFVNRYDRRILTSEGIDVSYSIYKGMIEVIADWNSGSEPVELMWLQSFGDLEKGGLATKTKELLLSAKARSEATAMPSFESVPVLLAGEAVKDFFDYYRSKGAARSIYEGMSSFELGKSVQGEQVTGDRLTMTLEPVLSGSSHIEPVDGEGTVLKPVTLIEKGILKSLTADSRFGAYMKVKPTGSCHNVRVQTGSHTKESLKTPYLELLAFSAFQMDTLTGDFGGEIRLARYVDGEKIQYFTGGALSLNIEDVKANMKFSVTEDQHDTFVGPSYVFFESVSVAGNE